MKSSADARRFASNYMKEQECTDFIVKVPVVWDDIKVLDARSEIIFCLQGDLVRVVCGALTDWTGRELVLDMSFLPFGITPLKFSAMDKCRQICSGL